MMSAPVTAIAMMMMIALTPAAGSAEVATARASPSTVDAPGHTGLPRVGGPGHRAYRPSAPP